MASEAIECSICCERFDELRRCPRLLSCGHTFCSSCIDRLIKQNAIDCPTCRNTVSVPAGVAALPKNFSLLDILLTRPQKEEGEGLRMCETCEDEEHPATSCCLDCEEDMCKMTARIHTRQKATRDHRVVSLDELKANPKLAAVSVFCSEHNEQFRFFDEDCGHVVCRDCVTLKHNGHKCSSLAEAATKYRQEIEALTTKASSRAEDIKAAEARLEDISVCLNKAHETQAAQMQSAFKELVTTVAAREQTLMNELDNLHKTKSLTLTEQRDRLRTFQACLESAAQRAKTAVQSPGNVELLVARSDIVSALGALEKQPPVLEPLTNGLLDFSIDLKPLLKVLSKAGVITDKFSCAANTKAEGMGLQQVAAGRKTSFTVTTYDVKGDLCGIGGDLFKAEVANAVGMKSEVNCKDNGDGTYSATYTAPASAGGYYSLSVLLRGAHIRGSPFSVREVRVAGIPVGTIARQERLDAMGAFDPNEVLGLTLLSKRCHNIK